LLFIFSFAFIIFRCSLLQSTVVTPSSTSVNVVAVESVPPVNAAVTPSSTSVDVAAVESVPPVDAVVTPSSTSVNVAAVDSVPPVDAAVTPSSTSVSVVAVDSVVSDSPADATTPLRSLIVIPKCVRVLRSKREVAHAKIITSSPYKRKLENAAEEKKKADSKRKRSEKSAEKKKNAAESKAKKAEAKIKQSEKSSQSKVKKASTKRKRSEKSAAGIKRNKKIGRKSDKLNIEDDDTNCLYCNELYSTSSEAWIMCQGPCQKWSHLSCAGLSAADRNFICEICDEL